MGVWTVNYSTGYGRLSDRELIHLYEMQTGHHNKVPLGWGNESKRRGLQVKTCSECGKYKIHYLHDYLCYACRDAAQGEDQQ